MIAIVGCRNAPVQPIITWLRAHRKLIPESGIVTGDAQGADRAAREFAAECSLPLMVFEADWNKYGKAAGPTRNTQIVNRCVSMICFWDGASVGTLNALSQAAKAGKSVRIVPISVL